MATTPIADIPVEDYVRRLRGLLAGLPRADVADIVEEVRSHLREQIAEAGEDDADQAVQAFGTPETFAAQVLERLGLAPGGAVGDAPLLLRALARTVDEAIGLLPLMLLFFSPVFALGLLVGPFLGLAGMTVAVSLVTAAYLAGCAVWAVWYLRWLPVHGHPGIGLRLTGLSRVRVAGGWRTVHTLDVAEGADARRRAKPAYAWLLVAVPMVAFAALFLLSFVSSLVGMALQPWDWVGESVGQRQDIERSLAVVNGFYAAVESGDADSAAKFVTPASHPEVAPFVSEASAIGVTRHEVGISELPTRVGVWEYFDTPRGKMRRHVTLVIRKATKAKDGRTYTTDYVIEALSRGRSEVPAADTTTW